MSLQLRGVTKTFGDPPVPALEGIDFTAETGTFTAIVGASGSGKSTLLRIVAGMTEPDAGEVTMGGRTPDELRRGKEVGWMAQRPALLPWRRVRDNIALAQSINPRPDRELPSPDELLEMVGLSHVAGSYPRELSGGMQQRVALARTLAIGAPLWLMDEPFSALDELTREALAEDLLRIWQQVRSTVLWVTHHIPEAVSLADHIVLLTPGPGRVAGTIDVDLARPRDPTSPAFQAVVRQARMILRGAQAKRVVA
ncbi:MAG: ABC transporter ATP-binding protein [Actinomycetes bacterium]|nr:ABC transporter ATP-binding protein [Acidimicrobiia bacterium]